MGEVSHTNYRGDAEFQSHFYFCHVTWRSLESHQFFKGFYIFMDGCFFICHVRTNECHLINKGPFHQMKIQ